MASTALAGSVSYAYDPLGRLLTATYANGSTIAYSYDAAGNRTQYTVGVGAPIAGPTSATVASNSVNNPIPLALTGGPATSVTVSTQPTHGMATATGVTISYSPSSAYSGSDSFQYSATGPGGTSAPATVSITVGSIPIANPVSMTVAFGSANNPVPLNLTGGVATGVSVSSQPPNGTAAASGLSITYSPRAGFSGADSFAYTAANTLGTSPPATVSVTVSAASAPVAKPVSFSVNYNSTGNPAPLSISGAFDSVAVSSVASHGTAAASGTSITYTPVSGYHGPDSFGYTASYGGSVSAPATASVTVNPAPTLVATLGAGLILSGPSSSHAFPANTVVVTGGSGNYTYAWSQTNDSPGTSWSAAGTTATISPVVSNVTLANGCASTGTYKVTVTDTSTSAMATSNTATYGWTNNGSSCSQ